MIIVVIVIIIIISIYIIISPSREAQKRMRTIAWIRTLLSLEILMTAAETLLVL